MAEFLGRLFSIEKNFVIDVEKQKRGLELMLENKRGILLKAETCGALVGMCSGQLLVSTAEGGPAVLAEDLFVPRQWRGRGVGSRLVHALEEWGRNKGCARIQILAAADNAPALAFYDRMGFARTGMVCLRRELGRRS